MDVMGPRKREDMIWMRSYKPIEIEEQWGTSENTVYAHPKPSNSILFLTPLFTNFFLFLFFLYFSSFFFILSLFFFYSTYNSKDKIHDIYSATARRGLTSQFICNS